jgi:hypothetical protein
MTDTKQSTDVLPLRKKNTEVTVRLVEIFGNWRVYQWKDGECVNWSVAVGRRFTTRVDALNFLQENGYVIVAESQSRLSTLHAAEADARAFIDHAADTGEEP